MSKVKEFINEEIEKKKKQLMGIHLDLQYWGNIMKENDEDELRKELKEENSKKIFNKNGTVFQDNRDVNKVTELNRKINRIIQAKEEKQKLEDMLDNIKNYFNFLKNPDEKTLKKLEGIEKL